MLYSGRSRMTLKIIWLSKTFIRELLDSFLKIKISAHTKKVN